MEIQVTQEQVEPVEEGGHEAASLADELRDWFVEGKSVHIGDKVIRKNGRIGTVIGGAIGKDGKHCLVLSMHDGHWRTYLCPIDEARKLIGGANCDG